MLGYSIFISASCVSTRRNIKDTTKVSRKNCIDCIIYHLISKNIFRPRIVSILIFIHKIYDWNVSLLIFTRPYRFYWKEQVVHLIVSDTWTQQCHNRQKACPALRSPSKDLRCYSDVISSSLVIILAAFLIKGEFKR